MQALQRGNQWFPPEALVVYDKQSRFRFSQAPNKENEKERLLRFF
jgi:hypothetical protein